MADQSTSSGKPPLPPVKLSELGDPEDDRMEGTAEEEAALESQRKELEAELVETEELLRTLQVSHLNQASELENMKVSMQKELQLLKAENWKMEAYADLEKMKGLLDIGEDDASKISMPPTPLSDSTNKPLGEVSAEEVIAEVEKNAEFEAELDEQMAAIAKQLEAAKQQREEMEKKKRDLQLEMELFVQAEGAPVPQGVDAAWEEAN